MYILQKTGNTADKGGVAHRKEFFCHTKLWFALPEKLHGLTERFEAFHCHSGMSIDPCVMLLTGADTIREVILFPTMKPLD